MATTTSATLRIKVDPKVSFGISSILGVLAAIGQFGASALLLIEDGQVDAVDFAPLATGAYTLAKTIEGRMAQAAAALSGPRSTPLEPVKYAAGWIGTPGDGNGMSAPEGNTRSAVSVNTTDAPLRDANRKLVERAEAAEAEVEALSADLLPDLDEDLRDGTAWADSPERPSGHAAGNPGEDPDAPASELLLSPGGGLVERAKGVTA